MYKYKALPCLRVCTPFEKLCASLILDSLISITCAVSQYNVISGRLRSYTFQVSWLTSRMKDRCWYLCLVCFLTEISGYQIPTFREVVRNATFVNGPPVPASPPTLNLSRDRQLLFPFMNFTCNGTITRLTFLGWLSDSSGAGQVDNNIIITGLTLGPYFSLWHPQYDMYAFEEINQIEVDQKSISISRSTLNNQLVEATLMTNVVFSQGDVLGIRLQQYYGTSIRSGISMKVLKQSRGYGTTLDCFHIGT